MNVLHLITSGNPGGIEVLCHNIGKYSDWNNHFCFMFGGGIITEQMKKEKMNVMEFRNIKLSLKKLNAVIKYIKENNIEIINIHNDDIFLQIYYLLLKIRFKKVKFVCTIHNCHDEIFYQSDNILKKKIKNYVLSKILKKSDLLISVSNMGIKSYISDFSFDIKKCITIYNGIEIDDPFDNTINTDKELNLLYIGRVIYYKGINYLLEAIKIVKKEGINIHLTIVGDGPDINTYKEFVTNNELENNVYFAGFDTEKKKYYRKNDLFIYPSVCEEIFGISIVEAMNASLPCIAFEKGGIPEIINDSKVGFIVKDVSATSLANCIMDVYNLKINNKIMDYKKNAYNRSKYFDIKNTIKSLKTEYSKLLEKK